MAETDETLLSRAGDLLSGRYRLVSPIARGGMAEVWEAEDETLGRRVAIKVLHRHLAGDSVLLERFRREAVAAARLMHPGIVATFDTGRERDSAYIVMELVRGKNLREVLDDRGRLTVPEALDVARQVAEALGYAHQAGVIHRDVKPANILLVRNDRGDLDVKVTDFGIAKAGHETGVDLTRTGIVLGTPKYVSPEQVRGDHVDARTDLYSLGVVLYEMLVGAPPYSAASDMATAMAHLNERIPRPSSTVRSIPGSVDRLVVELLAKRPDRRTQSAAELVHRLEEISKDRNRARPTRPAVERQVQADRADPPRTSQFSARPAGVAFAGGSEARDSRPVMTPLVAPPPPPPDIESSKGTQKGAGSQVEPTVQFVASAESALPFDRTSSMPAPVYPTGPDATLGEGGRGSSQITMEIPLAQATRTGLKRRERRIGIVVLVLLAAGGFLAARLLSTGSVKAVLSPLSTSTSKPGSISPPSTVGQLPVRKISVYMVVPGRQADNPQEAGNTINYASSASWSTDLYSTPNFGGLYSGIGLLVDLGRSLKVQRLEVSSPTVGWSGAVYMSERAIPSGNPASSWGQPLDSASSIDGSHTFSVGGSQGRYILFLITNLGPSDRVDILKLRVF
ncbi:MAG: protein kinase domain-containing protein [Acidimicrobiales bacterium]